MQKFVVLVLIVLMVAPAASAQAAMASDADAVQGLVDDQDCRRHLAATAPPVGIGSCPGVRPGALIQIRSGDEASFCTMNFAFTGVTASGRRGRYIGTAGHCVLGEGTLGQFGGGEQRWSAGSGPVARRSDGRVIGRVAYAVLNGDYDFALIRVNDGIGMSAKMCTFGGPTGMRADRPSNVVRLQYHGQGIALGETVPGRTAVANGMPHPLHVWAIGAAISGDSGSAVTSADGRAVGVLNSIGVFPPSQIDTFDAGVIGISRIRPLVLRAERFTGLDLTLRRAATI